ncbi:MAG TPA: signal peptidase I [Steroidobacteraceae bacterium]|jgi:signal peptidase I|nr:signal peptidase I [Steroidobacteraceae bacterium]
MLTQLLTILTIVAVVTGVIAVVEDWFLRPSRAPGADASKSSFMSAVHFLLPIGCVGAVLRLLMSERLDFSLILVIVVAATGLVWLLDSLLLAPMRARAAQARGVDAASVPLPVTVDGARSFFPVALIVLVVRAFVFEPFRIPSDSMMPTLLDGDFIIVNKFAYGLRLPVLDTKVVPIGEPKRGDVVVFHWPPDPAINYIKRLVGLPGDRVRIKSDQLIVNDIPIPLTDLPRYDDGCYHNMRQSTEILGTHKHQILWCLTPDDLAAAPTPSCNRHIGQNYVCRETNPPGDFDKGDADEMLVPPGEYLMIGDNRDNSSDGRYWGFVPEDHLVGKATRIWFNWDLGRSGGPQWSRMFHRIE